MEKENLEDLKKKVFEYYMSLGQVYCPYLNGYVEFTLKGFRRILSKGHSGRKLRSTKEQMLRLSLFKLAVKLIRVTTTLQEYSSDVIWIRCSRYKKNERKMTNVVHWSFVAILNDKRIKVIVKKAGDGKPYFWSIIPNWKTKKHLSTA